MGKDRKELGSANLYNWYLSPKEDGTWIAHGNVTKHPRITDSCYINTTEVQDIELQKDAVMIYTRNTRYTCKFDNCDWEKEGSYVKIPGLESLKGQYQKKETIDIPDHSILLRLSNGQEYYYDGAWVREHGKTEKLQMFPHVGMMRDSVIVSDEMMLHDLRYFPSDGHMRFYDWVPNGKDVYIENTGDSLVYVTTPEGVFSIEPEESKLIAKENVNSDIDKDSLPDCDLYGACIM